MKKAFFSIILLLAFVVSNARAQADSPIKIKLDFESAQLITKLMTVKTISDAQMNTVVAAYGNQQLIKKVKGYSGFGEDVFRATLKEVIQTGTVKGNDPYNWKVVKANLPQLQKLIAKLSANQQGFMADVTALIQSYTPAQVTANVRACFLVGGGSLGFVIGNEKTFNVALQKIGDDYEGLKYLVAHELYHTMQGEGQGLRKKTTDKNAPFNVQASYAIAYNVWSEGTATLVGDFAAVKTDAPFTKVQKEEWAKNIERQRQNFYLFETMMFKAAKDTGANYEELYNVGFTTSFDESLYFVGYEMGKKIEQYEGRKAIADMLVKDPLVFVEEYIKLYKEHKDDKSFIRFDASTEEIIAKLGVWKDKLF